MPVTCKQSHGKWRIVNPQGAIEMTEKGNGGGHASREACMAQARAINANIESDKASTRTNMAKDWH